MQWAQACVIIPFKVKILIHACCGPCLLLPAKLLRAEGAEVGVFWYNPNVQPYREYRRRWLTLGDVCRRQGLALTAEHRYDIDYFLRQVVTTREGRCAGCYAERLRRTAVAARQNGYDAFSSTLLISRHQDHDAIRAAGEEAARGAGVEFLYRDWRPWDAESHRLAREGGFYLQGYCGCIYSEEERYRRPAGEDTA